MSANSVNNISSQLKNWETQIESHQLSEQGQIDILPTLKSRYLDLLNANAELKDRASSQPESDQIKEVQTLWSRVFQSCVDTQIHVLNEEAQSALQTPDSTTLNDIDRELMTLQIDVRLRKDQKEIIAKLREQIKSLNAIPNALVAQNDYAFHFQDLPDDILLKIFNFLSVEEYGVISRLINFSKSF